MTAHDPTATRQDYAARIRLLREELNRLPETAYADRCDLIVAIHCNEVRLRELDRRDRSNH